MRTSCRKTKQKTVTTVQKTSNYKTEKLESSAEAIGMEVKVDSLVVGGSRSSLLTRKTGPGFTMLKEACVSGE